MANCIIENENRVWIGKEGARVMYTDAKHAIPGARRAATAAAKRGEYARFYIVEQDGSVYGKRVALVSINGVQFI